MPEDLTNTRIPDRTYRALLLDVWVSFGLSPTCRSCDISQTFVRSGNAVDQGAARTPVLGAAPWAAIFSLFLAGDELDLDVVTPVAHRERG